jgi:hypothetical protein
MNNQLQKMPMRTGRYVAAQGIAPELPQITGKLRQPVGWQIAVWELGDVAEATTFEDPPAAQEGPQRPCR